ncbi:MAG: hypothetical protein J1F11_06260 [Oscillospiraceae bacterium]|nr:hypothetical protein [Oscillospiraceae bacterium]
MNWIGGEDSESLVYIFTETDITEQHIIDGTIAEQHEGTYSITGIEYYRGNWRGTVTAKLGDRLCCLPFRTDRDGNALALGVSENANSPGYAKRLSHFLRYP